MGCLKDLVFARTLVFIVARKPLEGLIWRSDRMQLTF